MMMTMTMMMMMMNYLSPNGISAVSLVVWVCNAVLPTKSVRDRKDFGPLIMSNDRSASRSLRSGLKIR